MKVIFLRTRTRQMFIPWLLITVLMPTMFLLNLFTTLLFMQFHLAADLIVHEALIALVGGVTCLYFSIPLKRVSCFFPIRRIRRVPIATCCPFITSSPSFQNENCHFLLFSVLLYSPSPHCSPY